MKTLLAVAATAATLATTVAEAHSGHAQDAVHWHATDVWGFVMVGAAVALALWLRREK